MPKSTNMIFIMYNIVEVIKLTAKEMKIQFCKRIRELRNKEKLSLADLACRSGLPLEMLEKLERGNIPEEMMVDDTFALARAFHCEVYELFE